MIPQIFGSREQSFITEPYGNNSSMGLVRVVQSLPTRCGMKLHEFSMGFISGEFPGQSTTLTSCSSKIVSLFFAELQGAKSCLKISPPALSVHSISLTTFCRITSLCFSVYIIPVIAQCDRTTWKFKSPKKFFLGCLTLWMMMFLCDLLPITFPDMTTLLTLHQTRTFVGKKFFFNLLHSVIGTLCS